MWLYLFVLIFIFHSINYMRRCCSLKLVTVGSELETKILSVVGKRVENNKGGCRYICRVDRI